jgi:CxxC motif-containing protein
VAEKRRFVCIVCPRGCALEVELEAGTAEGPGPRLLPVRGAGCRRGEAYARGEILDPRRSLTSTIRAVGLCRRRLPVRTSGPIPLDRLLGAAAALDGLEAKKPVNCGDVLVKDFLGLGVDLIATDSLGLPAKEETRK